MNWGDTKLPARFWDKVSPEPNSGCWMWIGCLQGDGYGQLRVSGKAIYSHRLAYAAENGEHDAGLVLDHKCNNEACCNPEHLHAVTRKYNYKKWFDSNPNFRCGHPKEGNTYSWGHCKICHRAKNRARRAGAL